MQDPTTIAGLDVHARQTHAGLIDLASGELEIKRIPGPPKAVLGFLEALPGKVRAVYEAGPVGFALARSAAERGLDVQVCAPGAIPGVRQQRVKTDRRDAARLARLLLAGELKFVRIPTPAEEELRDLVRAREDLRGDLMRARHRLHKFLLRRELRFPGPGGNWTTHHLRWLSALCFDERASQHTYADYHGGVLALMQRRTTLDQALAELAPESPWAKTIARLRCFRGIETLTAVGLCAEVGDFGRFECPPRLASFIGIVPSEHTSDQKRRLGTITRAGSPHARRLLVEAAQHYRHQPRVSEVLARRQRGQDPRVCEVAWRCQRRLYGQWQKLRIEQRKPANVVVIAMARELSAFTWEAATVS